VVSHRLNLATA